MTQTIFSTGFPLSFFFPCHKPEVHRGSWQLLLPAQRGGSAVGQNPTVPGIIPREREDGSHLHVQSCPPSPAPGPASTQSTPQPPQRPPLLSPNASKPEHPSGINIPPVPTCEQAEKGKWLTPSYGASQSQQPQGPGDSFLLY